MTTDPDTPAEPRNPDGIQYVDAVGALRENGYTDHDITQMIEVVDQTSGARRYGDGAPDPPAPRQHPDPVVTVGMAGRGLWADDRPPHHPIPRNRPSRSSIQGWPATGSGPGPTIPTTLYPERATHPLRMSESPQRRGSLEVRLRPIVQRERVSRTRKGIGRPERPPRRPLRIHSAPPISGVAGRDPDAATDHPKGDRPLAPPITHRKPSAQPQHQDHDDDDHDDPDNPDTRTKRQNRHTPPPIERSAECGHDIYCPDTPVPKRGRSGTAGRVLVRPTIPRRPPFV